MTEQKNILIIAYTFPPYPGIGGRRWAKFAKYLAKQGYIVHIICAKNPFQEKSLWLDDVKSNTIKIYDLKSNYPSILSEQPKTFFEKVKYRLGLLFVNLFSSGTPYDKAIFWNKHMFQKSKELIGKYEIKNVIVSCAPFSPSFKALQLKKEFPLIKLMIDFRDPWTWGEGYGFKLLNNKRLEYEKLMERNVMEKANSIFVPSVVMKNHLDKFHSYSSKTIVLPHAFDKDDVPLSNKIDSTEINLVMYGTLYDGQNEIYEKLAKYISKSNGSITLDVFSAHQTYKDIFECYGILNNEVNYYNLVQPNQLFKKFSKYNYVLIIQPNYAKDYITTKLYEIIYSKTPLFVITEDGKLKTFIEKHKLGLTCDVNSIISVFEKIHEPHDFKIADFKITEYDYEYTTFQLTNHFI